MHSNISVGYQLIKAVEEKTTFSNRKKPVTTLIRFKWKNVAFIEGFMVTSYIYATYEPLWSDNFKTMHIHTKHVRQFPSHVVRAAVKSIELCKPQLPK